MFVGLLILGFVFYYHTEDNHVVCTNICGFCGGIVNKAYSWIMARIGHNFEKKVVIFCFLP